jgi:hypothetical protein
MIDLEDVATLAQPPQRSLLSLGRRSMGSPPA